MAGYLILYTFLFWGPQLLSFRWAVGRLRDGKTSLFQAYLLLYSPLLLLVFFWWFVLAVLLYFGAYLFLMLAPLLVFSLVLPFISRQPPPSREWQKKWLDT